MADRRNFKSRARRLAAERHFLYLNPLPLLAGNVHVSVSAEYPASYCERAVRGLQDCVIQPEGSLADAR